MGFFHFQTIVNSLKKSLKKYCIVYIIMVYYLSTGELVKRLNTPPFHGGIHEFESRTGHHISVWQIFILKVCFILYSETIFKSIYQ